MGSRWQGCNGGQAEKVWAIFSGDNSNQNFLLFGPASLQKQVIYFKTWKGLGKKSNISMGSQSNLFRCVK